MVEFISSHSAPAELFVQQQSSPGTSHETGGNGAGNGDNPFGDDTSWRIPFIYGDIITSMLALIGNILIMVALSRVTMTLAGYRRFLLSLATADIFMASTTVIAYFHEKLAHYYSSSVIETCSNNFLRSLTLVGYFSSLLSIAGLTADNYLGIFKPLRYKSLTGGGRVVKIIALLWGLALILGFIDLPLTTSVFLYTKQTEQTKAPTSLYTSYDNFFFDFTQAPPQPVETVRLRMGGDKNDAKFKNGKLVLTTTETTIPLVENYETPDVPVDDITLHELIQDVLVMIENDEQVETDWCTFYASNKFGIEFFVIGLTLPCFLLLIIINGLIFFHVLQRQSARHQKTHRLVLTTLLLIGAFALCWVPFVSYELYMYLQMQMKKKSSQPGVQTLNYSKKALFLNTVFNSLLMLSPLLNPIIYSIRIKRVRLELIAIFCGRKSSLVDNCSTKPTSGSTVLRGKCGSIKLLPNGIHHCHNSNNDCNQTNEENNVATGAPTGTASAWNQLAPSDINTPPNHRRKSSIQLKKGANGSAMFAGDPSLAKPDYRCNIRGCDALFLSQPAFFRHLTTKHSGVVTICDGCFEIYYNDQDHTCCDQSIGGSVGSVAVPALKLMIEGRQLSKSDLNCSDFDLNLSRSSLEEQVKERKEDLIPHAKMKRRQTIGSVKLMSSLVEEPV